MCGESGVYRQGIQKCVVWINDLSKLMKIIPGGDDDYFCCCLRQKKYSYLKVNLIQMKKIAKSVGNHFF